MSELAFTDGGCASHGLAGGGMGFPSFIGLQMLARRLGCLGDCACLSATVFILTSRWTAGLSGQQGLKSGVLLSESYVGLAVTPCRQEPLSLSGTFVNGSTIELPPWGLRE